MNCPPTRDPDRKLLSIQGVLTKLVGTLAFFLSLFLRPFLFFLPIFCCLFLSYACFIYIFCFLFFVSPVLSPFGFLFLFLLLYISLFCFVPFSYLIIFLFILFSLSFLFHFLSPTTHFPSFSVLLLSFSFVFPLLFRSHGIILSLFPVSSLFLLLL